MPERRGCLRIIGIEGVDAIVHSGDKYHITPAFSGNGQVGHVQRLCVDVAVHSAREQLSELSHVYIGGVEDTLFEIGSRPTVVIMLGEHSSLASGRPVYGIPGMVGQSGSEMARPRV